MKYRLANYSDAVEEMGAAVNAIRHYIQWRDGRKHWDLVMRGSRILYSRLTMLPG